jgi:hypothetical protein
VGLAVLLVIANGVVTVIQGIALLWEGVLGSVFIGDRLRSVTLRGDE